MDNVKMYQVAQTADDEWTVGSGDPSNVTWFPVYSYHSEEEAQEAAERLNRMYNDVSGNDALFNRDLIGDLLYNRAAYNEAQLPDDRRDPNALIEYGDEHKNKATAEQIALRMIIRDIEWAIEVIGDDPWLQGVSDEDAKAIADFLQDRVDLLASELYDEDDEA